MRRVATMLGLIAIAVPMVALGMMRLNGWRPLVEQTGSMAPMLTPGDVFLTKSISAGAVRHGDVLTFAHPSGDGRTITHRVLSVTPVGSRLRITTQGDANPAPEVWMIRRDGHVGRLQMLIGDPAGIHRLAGQVPERGIMMIVLTLLACGSTLSAIWRRPPACAPSS